MKKNTCTGPFCVAATLTAASALMGCAFIPGSAAFAQEPAAPEPATQFDARYFESQLLEAAGDAGAAQQVLEQTLRDGEAPDAIFESLARTQAAGGKVDEALKTLADGLAKHPGSIKLLLVRASVLREKGDVNAALADLENVLKASPDHQQALEMLSELHLSRLISNPGNADAEMKELIAIYNRMLAGRTGLQRLPPLLVLNTLYLRTGEADKAVEASAEALRISPRNPRILTAHAGALVSAGRTSEAIDVYGAALVADPANADVLQKLQALLISDGGEKRRTDFFVKLAADHPDNVALVQSAVRVLVNQKQYPEAEKILAALIADRPEDVPNRLALMQVWMEMGRIDDVLAEAKRLAEDGGELAPAITLSVAETLDSTGRRAEALELLENYNARHPANENVTLGLASLLVQQDKMDKAAGILEKLTAEKPENFAAASLLAGVYADSDRFEDAHKLLQALPPTVMESHRTDVQLLDAGLYLSQGMDLIKAAKFAEAEAALKEAGTQIEAIDGSQPIPVQRRRLGLRTALYMNQGLLHQKRGDNAAAEASYRDAIASNPEDAEPYNNLGYFFAQIGERLDEAEKLVQKALELSPGAPHIIDSLGWVYFKQERYPEAIEQLEAAIKGMEDDPGAAEVYDHLGDAYGKIGRDADARKAWTKALDLKGDIDPAPIVKKLGR